MLLRGAQGTGKTTFVLKFAHRMQKEILEYHDVFKGNERFVISEQSIKKAFQAAEKQNKILFCQEHLSSKQMKMLANVAKYNRGIAIFEANSGMAHVDTRVFDTVLSFPNVVFSRYYDFN